MPLSLQLVSDASDREGALEKQKAPAFHGYLGISEATVGLEPMLMILPTLFPSTTWLYDSRTKSVQYRT